MTKKSILLRIVILLSFLIPVLVLIGWMWNIGLLKTILPNYVSMKTNTAICFLLSAITLGLFLANRHRYGKFSLVTNGIVLLLSVVFLAEYLFNLDLHIDQLIVKEVDANGYPYPGRMAFTTAVSFLLISIGFFGVYAKYPARFRIVCQYLLHVVTFTAFIAIIGYLFKVPAFYRLSFLTSMALHTAVLFFLLSIAFSMLLPRYGFARLFLGNEAGNVMARQMFPATFIAVIALGYIRLETHWHEMITVEMGIAMFGLSFIVVSLVLINITAKNLNKADRKRAAAQMRLSNIHASLERKFEERTRELNQSNERNKIFIESAPSAIAMFDTDMKYMAASQQWYKDYKIEGQDIIGKSHYEVFPEITDEWKQKHQRCLKGEINKSTDGYFLRADGTEQWIMWDVRPWYIAEGKVGGLLISTADITGIKKQQKEIQKLLDVTTEQNERLKNFAHIVSHNLRTHSGNISMLLQLYAEEQPEVVNNELVSSMQMAASNLRETIMHLNEVVGINNAVSTEMKLLHLNHYVNSAIQSVGALVLEREVQIINEVPVDLYVQGVEAYLDSIVLNFLTNGIKYSSADRASYVKFSAYTEGEFTVLTIADNGMGMDMRLVGNKLFGMYKTFHGNKDAKGIGLFITRNQIEAMGGDITVESTPDVGTTFKIYLKNA